MKRLSAGLSRHGSVRLRLALMSAALFLVLGTVLIAVLYGFAQRQTTVSVTATPNPATRHAAAAFRATLLAAGPGQVRQSLSPLRQVTVTGAPAGLLTLSWVLLLLTALASIPLGWFASGWMLAPLRRITERTRNITAGNLHERLALVGPRDEFTELGDTLDELFARLEASFDAQRRFVANASHELRTPLTLERTLLQVALADPDVSAVTLRAVCEELLASGREHERLLEAMLTLASSERRLEHRASTDLAVLTADVLARPRPEIEALQLTVTSDLQPSVTDGDPALIERLISNLIDNAVRHNVSGGHVEIRTESTETGALITIENSGQPIAHGEIETMFEPFRRLGAPRTGPDSSQHGLGLSIVRAIANTHAANVSARPRAEGGLTISVRFPLTAPGPGHPSSTGA